MSDMHTIFFVMAILTFISPLGLILMIGSAKIKKLNIYFLLSYSFSTYLMQIAGFGFIYELLYKLDKTHFIITHSSNDLFVDFLHYSTMVITTGSSNIYPVSIMTKILAIIEVLIGLIIVVYVFNIAISRLLTEKKI